MILSNLYAGWCDFCLDEFKGRPSYMKSVPLDVLEGVLDYVTYKRCVISFDEEGSDFYLIADDYFHEAFIVSAGKVIEINKHPDIIIAILYDDIISKKEEWVDWLADNERDRGSIRKQIERYEVMISEYTKKQRIV